MDFNQIINNSLQQANPAAIIANNRARNDASIVNSLRTNPFMQKGQMMPRTQPQGQSFSLADIFGMIERNLPPPPNRFDGQLIDLGIRG